MSLLIRARQTALHAMPRNGLVVGDKITFTMTAQELESRARSR